MSKIKENMAFIQCGGCEHILPLALQYPVAGVNTFEYRCEVCRGSVQLQIVRGPDGHPVAKQVQLTNSADEWCPNPIRPHSQVQIPVAYTLGAKGKSSHHVPVAPLKPPAAAYTLGRREARRGPRPFPLNHPMHPTQLRRRIQPQGLGQQQ